MIQTFIVSILLVSANIPLSRGQTSGGSLNNCPNSVAPSNLRVLAFPDSYYIAGPPPSGFLVDLLNALAQKAGVTFSLTTAAPNYSIGTQNVNGTWDGSLLGALINNQADLALADITISSNRENVVDFLVPYNQYQLQILYNTQFGLGSSVQYVTQDNADLGALKNSKDTSQQAIANNIQAGRPGSIVATDAEGLAKVLSGNFAYVAESPFPDQAIAANSGKLAKTPVALATYYLSLAVQPGSPLREKLNIALLQLEEAGTVQSLLNKYGLNS